MYDDYEDLLLHYPDTESSLKQTDVLEGSGNSGLVDLNSAFSGNVLAIQTDNSLCLACTHR